MDYMDLDVQCPRKAVKLSHQLPDPIFFTFSKSTQNSCSYRNPFRVWDASILYEGYWTFAAVVVTLLWKVLYNQFCCSSIRLWTTRFIRVMPAMKVLGLNVCFFSYRNKTILWSTQHARDMNGIDIWSTEILMLILVGYISDNCGELVVNVGTKWSLFCWLTFQINFIE